MHPAYIVTLGLGFFCCCVAFTRYLIGFSVRRQIIAIPNERSSHSTPVPKIGGLSVVLALMCCALGIEVFLAPAGHEFTFLAVGMLGIGVTGLADDTRELNALLRGGIYLCVCYLFLLATGAWTMLFSPHGLVLLLIAGLGMAWLVNLYNFMDGADGLAASQAIAATLPALLFFHLQHELSAFLLCLALVASVSGFLYWNFPPARIFMGDTGSCALGFFFAAMVVLSADSVLLWIWLLSLSCFVTDATLTLCRRMLHGEAWHMAHRGHVYQLYLRAGNSHLRLLRWFWLITVVLIWPACVVCWLFPVGAPWFTLCVYVLLSLIWYLIRRTYAPLCPDRPR